MRRRAARTVAGAIGAVLNRAKVANPKGLPLKLTKLFPANPDYGSAGVPKIMKLFRVDGG
jgi:hypothetical protein